MKFFTTTLALTCTLLSFSQDTTEQFTFPAEFEKHDAIWMAASGGLTPKNELLLKIIPILAPYITINLIVDHESTASMLEAEFKMRSIDERNVRIFVHGAEVYRNVRDPGPVFLKGNKGNLMI